MKPPNWTFHGERGHTTKNFPSSFWTWIKSLRIQPQEKSPAFDILSGSKQTRLSLKEPKFIFLPPFSLPSSSSLLKVPNNLRSGGRSSTKFCRLFWIACKLRCFRLLTITLFLRQNKLFVQRVCTWKNNRSPSCQQDTENLSRFARAKSAFLKFAYSARAVHEREKITQKSGLHESPPRRQFKDGIFRFG